MSLTLTLEPSLEERLRLEAEQRGLSVELWLAQELEQRFQTTDEATLLERITGGLPASFWMQYRALIAKRDAEDLSDAERLELIAMADQTEALTLRRTEALVELATRRSTTVSALRSQFGLQPVAVQS